MADLEPVRAIAGATTILCLLAASCGSPARAPPPVGPAQRIVTLAPHLAELAYSAGAGDRLIGVAEFTDYPEAARRLPRVGDAFHADFERIAELHPDLVLAWGSGTPPRTLERLRSLGYRVVAFEPVTLEDIASHLRSIGELAGTDTVAESSARAFLARLGELRAAHAGVQRVRVFAQLSARPYVTVTGRNFLGQAIALCGGENVFGALPGDTAVVTTEAVITALPQVIVASDMSSGSGAASAAALADWRRWPAVPAVRDGNLILVDADLLSRPGVRILDGIDKLCAAVDRARGGRRATDAAAR
jgi:iron complex transport system substrate-binding protein